MNEFDENGWSHIHQAAFRGFVKSVERFVSAGEDQLELETQDSLKSTPFLLAVMSGNIETVECLVSLGASIDAIDNQNNGAVELCSFKQFIHLLEYFIKLNNPALPVWKRLVRFMSSDLFEESESASKCIWMMTKPDSSGLEPLNWRSAHDNNIVQTIVKVNMSTLEDVAKTESLKVMLNLSQVEIIRKEAVQMNILQCLVSHLKSHTPSLVEIAAKNISVFAIEDSYADQLVQGSVISALIKVINTMPDVAVLVEVAGAIGVIAENRSNHQQTLGNSSVFIAGVNTLFNESSNKDLLLALLIMSSKLCNGNTIMQNLLTAGDIGMHCITLMRVKHMELQLEAVKAIRALVSGNSVTAAILLQKNAVNSLMQLLRKHEREPSMTEQTVLTLWAIAGNDLNEQMNVSAQIGVSLLVDFLKTRQNFEKLNYIGCECLGVLAQGPRNKCEQIASANGVAKLVVLLSASNECIVLSAIRTLRYLCVGVAYITNPTNQVALSENNGIKYLIGLMASPKEGVDLLRVEAALTLATATLGNQANYDQLMASPDFSYVRVLRLIYHTDPEVRVKAGAALATFSYNSLHNQNEITMHGGLRFACFEDFLKSENEIYRCNVAFQVVVLSRIISDEEQAISSAAGIRLLVDLLKGSKCEQILALAADIVARLCHVRAGIPSAFVSINTVEILAVLLRHHSDQTDVKVRGCSSIALSYLSYNPFGQRQLLNCCRKDPALMKVLLFYKGKISSELMEGWKHYEVVGLRPTSEIILKEDAKSAEYQISPRHTTSLGNQEDLLTSSTILDQSGQTLPDASGGQQSRGSQTPFRTKDNNDVDLTRLLTPGDDDLTLIAADDNSSVQLSLPEANSDCISLCSADTDISHTVAAHVMQEY